jgi:hypothetical protein
VVAHRAESLPKTKKGKSSSKDSLVPQISFRRLFLVFAEASPLRSAIAPKLMVLSVASPVYSTKPIGSLR